MAERHGVGKCVARRFPSASHMPPRDIADAVRDTVTVRGRTRVARSNTAQHVVPLSPGLSLTICRTPPAAASKHPARRSHSQESKGKKTKKGSQHADVIDRLDFTGVGPMFHHDGPFDACAPSRNRQRSNAPMFAWSHRQEDAADPAAHRAPDQPKKKVDAIAEAWGIHEPEPFEDFAAGGGTGKDTPASSIYNGRDSHHKKRPARPQPDQQAKRSVPPPQPIFVPDSPQSSPPQRKKSLMQRIRNMRDAPNVPVTADYDPPSEPIPARPTHRSQNSGSFLGRFAAPRPAQPPAEPFVYIEPSLSNKELPPPPLESGSPPEVAGYFDSANRTNSGSPGIVRKTSLMKKVGRVVGRNRQ
ncbi:hypothetical protein H2248_000936 [Termitomyces sp. 'cryptogamus']|nr:hypothetical protein H2248_000936 [Termitomyces sp. 'cryptogamus']